MPAPLQVAGAGGPGAFQQTAQKGGGGAGKGGPTPAEKELYNFKTSMCNNFTNTGTCQRGERCSFAHGEDELMAPGQAKQVMEKMESGEAIDGMDGFGSMEAMEGFTGF